MIVAHLAFSLASAAQATALPPRAIDREEWLSPDDVPLDVLKARKGGVVGYELQVSEAGKVTACRVTQSSGLPSLDAATCAALTERALFQPAQSAEGRSIVGLYRSKATFEPPVVDAKAHEGPRLNVTRLTLRPDGTLIECGTEGDDPEPISLKSCERILQSERGTFFKQMAGTYSVFRIADAWTPPMYKARPALKSWGDRLAYRVDIEIFNSQSLKSSCYTSQSDGRLDLLGKGCADKEQASKSDIRRSHPGIIFRMEAGIFAAKR